MGTARSPVARRAAVAAAAVLALAVVGRLGARTASVSFELRVLDRSMSQPWLKAAGDLDGDHRPDLLVGGHDAGGLVAYLDRYPHWKRTVIDAVRTFSTDAEVIDLDGDGRNDIVALTASPDGVVWYEAGASWRAHRVNQQTWHDVEVADFDGDGLPDLVGRNQKEWPHESDAGDSLHFVWQQRVNGTVSWTEATVPCPAGEGLLVTDMDGDGDADVVVNQRWYENLGQRRWAGHVYASDAAWRHPNTFIASGDINGDGRLDLVLSPSELKGERYKVSWFESPVTRTAEWTEHTVAPDVETVMHFAGVADFDLDGRADVVVAEMPQGADPDEVSVFLNRGRDVNGRWQDAWKQVVVSDDGSHSMRILDADGDGRPDLFGANWSAQGRDESVKLWLNRQVQ